MKEGYPRKFLELEGRFSTADACRQYRFAPRWPGVFVCPVWAAKMREQRSQSLVARACRRRVSAASGTIFQDSRISLRLWFRAMWHMTSQKNGLSALGS